MAAPEVTAIYHWMAEGKSVEQVRLGMAHNFERQMSIRNIYKYRKRWQNNNAARSRDKPVDWSDVSGLLSQGVDGQHLPAIRHTSAWARSVFGALFEVQPTVRSARWQSYVLTYAPSVRHPLDLWVLGERFAMRELLSDYSGDEVHREDIDAHLSYRPWEDDEKERFYLEAVAQRIVPKISEEIDTCLDGPQERAFATAYCSSVILVMYFQSLVDEQAHLLPSQQLREHKERHGKLPKLNLVNGVTGDTHEVDFNDILAFRSLK